MEDNIQWLEPWEDGKYILPFDVLDKTEGGSNLGRIEWTIETLQPKRWICTFLIEARQTRDIRYKWKTLGIKMWTSCIGSSFNEDSFIKNLWITSYCKKHKTTIMCAYPQNHHTKLVIWPNSSVYISVYFE